MAIQNTDACQELRIFSVFVFSMLSSVPSGLQKNTDAAARTTQLPSALPRALSRSSASRNRGGAPKVMTDEMLALAEILDRYLLDDLTNIVLHYIQDGYFHCLSAYSTLLMYVFVAAGPPRGRLVRTISQPNTPAYYCGVAVCGDELLAADQALYRVRVFRISDGSFVREFGNRSTVADNAHALVRPFGIGVSEEHGLAFISESVHCLSVWRIADGSFVRRWGHFGSSSSSFSGPHGVAVADDLVYVADRDNHRVQVFQFDGSFVRSLGDSILNFPYSQSVHSGLVYVAERWYFFRISLFSEAVSYRDKKNV